MKGPWASPRSFQATPLCSSGFLGWPPSVLWQSEMREMRYLVYHFCRLHIYFCRQFVFLVDQIAIMNAAMLVASGLGVQTCTLPKYHPRFFTNTHYMPIAWWTTNTLATSNTNQQSEEMWRAWRVLKDVQKRTFSEASQGFSVNHSCHSHVFIVYLRGVAFGVLSPCFASLICSLAPKELQGQVFGLAIVVTWHLVPTPYAHRGAFYCGSVWWDLCTSCLWSLKSPAWFTRQFKMSDFKHEEMIGKYSKCVNQIQE